MTTTTITTTDPILKMSDVRLRLGKPGTEASPFFRLDSLELRGDERLALTGPSGCGKTTLIQLAVGLIRPDNGSILLAGREVTKLSPAAADRHRGHHVGLVFQQFNLLEALDAEENVLAGLRFATGNVPRAEWKNRARAVLDRVGLAHRRGAKPRTLSAGERQRVAIARAIAPGPRVIVADEPTGALDPRTADSVFKLLLDVCDEQKCALLMVTHDHDLADRLERRFECHDLVAEAQETTA